MKKLRPTSGGNLPKVMWLSKGQSQDANPGGPVLCCTASRAHQVVAVWPGLACTHLEILHGGGLLCPLAEHRPLQGVAPAGLQDVVEGREIWKGEARSCPAVSGVGKFRWAARLLPSCMPRLSCCACMTWRFLFSKNNVET